MMNAMDVIRWFVWPGGWWTAATLCWWLVIAGVAAVTSWRRSRPFHVSAKQAAQLEYEARARVRESRRKTERGNRR